MSDYLFGFLMGVASIFWAIWGYTVFSTVSWVLKRLTKEV